jgi:hypothetical protein
MGIYSQTARLFAQNPSHLAVLKKESVRFNTRGWLEFAKFLREESPDIAHLLYRVDCEDQPMPARPLHPTYLWEDEPLELAWTADECRQLFLGMSRASRAATERAYDFWELLALVCCGINEEGIVTY